MVTTIKGMSFESVIEPLLSQARIQTLVLAELNPEGNGRNSPCGAERVDILRLDSIHPILSGNKLFKLAGYLVGLDNKVTRLVTPGGVHSNHLHALAAVGALLGIETVGLVRGYASQPLTDTLKDCQHWGMRLEFLDRKTYARRYDPVWQQQQANACQAFWVGEGGSGAASRFGGRYLADYCAGYDEVWLAVGSGTTAEMLLPYLEQKTTLVGVNVVADQGERQCVWEQSLPTGRWRLLETASWGRFGHLDATGQALIQQADRVGLPLDPVYGVRLLRAFLEHGPVAPGGRCLLIHGGGLQGRRGYGLDWPLVGHDEPALNLTPAPGA